MPGIYVTITQWGWGSKNEPTLTVCGEGGADAVDSNLAVQHYCLQCFTSENFATTVLFKFGETTLLQIELCSITQNLMSIPTPSTSIVTLFYRGNQVQMSH